MEPIVQSRRRKPKPFETRKLGGSINKTIIIGDLSFTISTTCLFREGGPICRDTSHIEGKYLRLSPMFGGYVIRCCDLIKRVDDRYIWETLGRDIESDPLQVNCNFWDSEGNPVPNEIIQTSRLGLALHLCKNSDTSLNNIHQQLDAYRGEWVLCLKFAIWAANYHDQNPFQRFYKVPDQQLCLYIFPGPSFNTPSQQALLVDSVKEARSTGCDDNIVPVLVLNQDPHEMHSLIHLSTNPLGLYSTWMDSNSLDKLVGMQMKNRGKRWAQMLPEAEQVELFNNDLLKVGSPMWKQDSLEQKKCLSMLLWPGEIFKSYKRRTTASVMGGSANQWAIKALGWPEDNARCAEWLHMIAHRFAPNIGDRFDNLMFGTKECNTDMMRAEAAVDQLLYSGKISAVGIEVIARYNLPSATMLDGGKHTTIDSTWSHLAGKHPKWLALAFEYKIQAYVPHLGNNYCWESWAPVTTNFDPFSSRCPLLFEYTLDRICLNKLLATLDFELEPGYMTFGPEISRLDIWNVHRPQYTLDDDELGQADCDDEDREDEDYFPDNQRNIKASDARFYKRYKMEHGIREKTKGEMEEERAREEIEEHAQLEHAHGKCDLIGTVRDIDPDYLQEEEAPNPKPNPDMNTLRLIMCRKNSGFADLVFP